MLYADDSSSSRDGELFICWKIVLLVFFSLLVCVFNLVNFPEVLSRLSTVSEKQTDG